jgi:zinc transport system ATP-binding protein
MNLSVSPTSGNVPASGASVPLVSIRDLRVRLGEREVLCGVNAALVRHQITALIGLNGAGKSTLLRALVKEVPYTGEVLFHCGHDHSRPAPEHVGYVPQKLRIDTGLPLTVLDLFGMAMQKGRPLFLGVPRSLRERARSQLEGVGAAHLLNVFVEKLSGGELQRVLLALALEPHPELLLLDEPAAGIDFREQDKFHELIGNLNRRTRVTILLVSHDLSVVSGLADHVLCLQDGLIRCEGSPREILTREVLASTFGTDKVIFTHSHGGHHPGGEEHGIRKAPSTDGAGSAS